MLLDLLRSEVFKVTRRAMPRILLLILCGLLALIYFFFVLAVRTNTEQGNPQAVADLRDSMRVAAVLDTGLGIVHQVGTVLAVILGVSLISSEFSWGTIRLILPRIGSRAGLLTAKLLVLLGFVVLLVLTGYLVALLSSFVASSVEDLSTSLGGDVLSRTVASLARTAYAMLPYVAIAIFVAVLTRSTAAGIAIGLSVLFLESIVAALLGALPGPFDVIPDALLARNVSAMLATNPELDGATK